MRTQPSRKVLRSTLLFVFLSLGTSPAFAQVTNLPLELLQADGTASNTTIRLSFSKPLLESTATNLANYLVTNVSGGGTLPLLSVELLDPTNVLLQTTSPRAYRTNYLALAQGLRDNANHLISSNNAAPVSTLVTLLSEKDFWYFYNPIALYGDTVDLGIAWRQPNYQPYDPSINFWSNNQESSRGVFFFGDTNFPGTPGFNLSASDVPIIYFRTHVASLGSPLGSSFFLSHLVQDGAVFFLNGPEASRFNMPTGTVTWNTFASNPVEPLWRGPESFPTLQVGTNALCAELHLRPFQFAFTSAVFAARLQAKFDSFALGPVVITRQPADRIVWEGQDATFTFQGAGAERFQWYQGNTLIPGATNPSLTLLSVTQALSGTTYSVAAWNSTSTNRTSAAKLTVLQDTNPPVLLAALITSSNQVEATFSEPVDALTASNPTHFAILNHWGQRIAITSATLTSPTNVLLDVVPGTGNNYWLSAQNIRDLSQSGNTSSNAGVVVIGLKVTISMDSSWKYNQSGADLGAAWRQRHYDDSSWPEGSGPFYQGSGPLSTEPNTRLNLITNSGPIRTFHFRKHLDMPFGLTATLSFNQIIDDGAIFYSNGTELRRFNMPTGTVNYGTAATGMVANPQLLGPYTSFVQLVQGDNVLAVEVHQSENESEDVCFGVEGLLAARTGPPLILPEDRKLYHAIIEGEPRLRWNFARTLYKASALKGSATVWEVIPNATSPYTIVLTNATTFFKLSP